MRLATLDTPTSSGGIATGFRGVFIVGLDGDRVVGMARGRDLSVGDVPFFALGAILNNPLPGVVSESKEPEWVRLFSHKDNCLQHRSLDPPQARLGSGKRIRDHGTLVARRMVPLHV